MTFKLKLGNKKPVKQPKPEVIGPKVFLADRIYIPTELVKIKELRKHYDRYVFKQEMCNRCEIFKNGERFSELCATCDGFKGRFKTYSEIEIKEEPYYGLPAGSLSEIEENLGLDFSKTNLKDMRADVKAKHPLNFTKKLYNGTEVINGVKMANQRKIVKQFFEHKRGLIQSPPRSGKTVIGTYIVCRYQRRTLVIAHEKQLLRQFFRTLLDFTDLREQRKKTGKKIAGIIDNDKDWVENWDIVLCTYQKFIRANGFKRIRNHIVRKFGLLIVDEAHRSSAEAYVNFISKLDMKYKIGLSATMTRKDKLHFLMHQMLGGVVSKGTTRAMRPRVEIISTNLKPQREWKGRAAYTHANRWLSQNKERNKLLIKNIFQDLRENPKHCIIIPVMFVDQVLKLVKLINAQAQYNNENKGEKWSDELAQPYYNKVNTSQALTKAREGKETRVTIGIRKMIKEGIDVPAWTHMYLTFPMNNHEDFYQMTQRICTTYEGKPEPVLKLFVDGLGLSYNCFAPTYQRDIIHYKYNVDKKTRVKAFQLMQKTNRYNKPEENLSEVW